MARTRCGAASPEIIGNESHEPSIEARRPGRAYSCWRGESVTRGDRRRRELGFGDRRRRSPASPNRRRDWALWVGVGIGTSVIYCHWPKQWNLLECNFTGDSTVP